MRSYLHRGGLPLTGTEQTRRALSDVSSAAIRENVSLKDHTSFRIGGRAAFFAEATTTQETGALLKTAATLRLPVLLLGGGTNLLINDGGFDGLVVHLALRGMDFDPEKKTARVESGVPTAALVSHTVEAGWGGMAFAAGLPGSVGGGLAGNAGCFGKCLGDVLTGATIVSIDGTISRVADVAWFAFGYRHSRLLREQSVITEAAFQFAEGDPDGLRLESDANIALRRKKHPLPGTFTAGSFFKNLPPKNAGEHRIAAGLLLDQVGAREMSVGDAAVFERHANIVINNGTASADDVLALTDAMRARVYDRFNVHLEREVRYVGPRGFEQDHSTS